MIDDPPHDPLPLAETVRVIPDTEAFTFAVQVADAGEALVKTSSHPMTNTTETRDLMHPQRTHRDRTCARSIGIARECALRMEE